MKIATIAAACIALAGPAIADCAASDVMRANLSSEFGEGIIAAGTQGNGVLIEVWRSPDTKSWTVLETDPARGVSCILMFGESMAVASETGDPA